MFHKIKKYLFAAIAGMILTAGVTAGAAAANITANTLTPVRRGAGPEYQTITAIRAGQTVEKLGTSGNWIKVNANGKNRLYLQIHSQGRRQNTCPHFQKAEPDPAAAGSGIHGQLQVVFLCW